MESVVWPENASQSTYNLFGFAVRHPWTAPRAPMAYGLGHPGPISLSGSM